MSSSGHVALLPRLLGWEKPGKTFEVALHAGSAPALLLALRGERPRDLHLLALTLAPPALAGLAFERAVEERLGGPRSVAVAQILAGAALATSLAALPLARSTRWRAIAAYRIALGAAGLCRQADKRRKLGGSRMAG